MRTLVFSSANPNKIQEVSKKLGDGVRLIGLTDIGCNEELPETSDTIEGNARQKAWYVWTNYHKDCFADDTGLEVKALYNAPGVSSAMYAGPQRSAEDNINKLLSEMENQLDRSARFRTVICLILGGKEFIFEGMVEGHITRARQGVHGFGYDPVFIPNGYSGTFAEMTIDEKNIVSHRGRAIAKLKEFLLHNKL